MKKFAPRLRQQLDRTLTIPRTTTMQSQVHGVANAVEHPAGVPLTRSKSAPYLTFPATIGRNSNFRYLTEDELEELGGVEYRALNALLWIVGAYHILVQVIAFIVIWPYISHARWRSNFQVPQLHRYVAPGWFSAFQVVSSYTNTGMSLVDQSMVPFQRAYPMIFFMAFLILAGNTAFVSIMD
jgi:Trk-type K+ transport system membrane component